MVRCSRGESAGQSLHLITMRGGGKSGLGGQGAR
jgi:hypothetical protein